MTEKKGNNSKTVANETEHISEQIQIEPTAPAIQAQLEDGASVDDIMAGIRERMAAKYSNAVALDAAVKAAVKAKQPLKGKKGKNAPQHRCACEPWCGEMTKSKWFPGHDSKFKSRIMKEERALIAAAVAAAAKAPKEEEKAA